MDGKENNLKSSEVTKIGSSESIKDLTTISEEVLPTIQITSNAYDNENPLPHPVKDVLEPSIEANSNKNTSRHTPLLPISSPAPTGKHSIYDIYCIY